MESPGESSLVSASSEFEGLCALSLQHVQSARLQNKVVLNTNKERNVNACRRGCESVVQGAAVLDGRLASFPLPRASTAIEGDAGQICLRALVVSLLCFYATDTVTNVLAEVVPQALVHYEQEGDILTIEGPVLAAFRQYVVAVAAEEDSNRLRQQLLEFVETRQSNVSRGSLHELLSSESLTVGDLPYTTGSVKWVLTPLHRRSHETYPTRSFQTWSLAVVMSELGFQVSASPYAVSTVAQYDSQLSDSHCHGGRPEVVLVISSVGKTDPLAPEPTRLNVHVNLKPRMVPIRSVPWIAFRRRAGAESINTKYLSDVWEYAFHEVSRLTSPPSMKNGNVFINVDLGQELIHTEHRALARLWSVHIERGLRAPLHQFVQRNDGIADAVQACSRAILEGREIIEKDGDAVENWYIMTAIVLATIFAVCAKSLQADENAGGAHTEVAFPPDLIYTKKVYDWADIVGRTFSGITSSVEWTGMLLEVVTGVSHPVPLDDRNTNLLSRRWEIIPSSTNQERTRVNDVFGIQANGIAMVSAFLVKPSIRPEALLRYHIQYGQLLDIPIDDVGYIRSAKIAMRHQTISLTSEPFTQFLRAGRPNATIRIDVEPSWETDQRNIVFKARVEGMPVCTLSPELVSRRIHYSTVSCTCSVPVDEVEVNEPWQTVPVSKLLAHGGSKVDFGKRSKVYVPAWKDDVSQILCAGLLECRRMVIALNCLSCAHKQCLRSGREEESFVIIG